MRLRDVTGGPLPAVLESGIIDADVFRAGQEVMARRYGRLGVRVLLPLERVWAGTLSAAAAGTARACGGFHHRVQGYRHVQMDASVTVFGDLTGGCALSPQFAALDLVRSYAHDCLHYATFRRYRLSDRGEIARVQYGINRRHLDGRTYSAPDVPGDGGTRNLGIVMEGATDAEATSVARAVARSCGIAAVDSGGGSLGLAFAEATGALAAGDAEAALSSRLPYERSLGGFSRGVTARYRALLRELGGDPGELHDRFVMAMISGDIPALEAWLGARHGPGAFARLFRAASYGDGNEAVR